MGEIEEIDIDVTYNAHTLKFIKPVRTSRDILDNKPSFFITIRDKYGRKGVGECSLIPGLSLETEQDVISALEKLKNNRGFNLSEIPKSLPSVRFALETAIINLKKEGEAKWLGGIPINGLVWMDSVEGMLKQVDILVSKGFKTIKLKVGTLPFDEEIEMLREIRKKCPAKEFTLRIDANGAFGKDSGDGITASEKLEALAAADLNIHSIEQPIPAGHHEHMAVLCASSPIPIALDEELIGVSTQNERRELLEKIKPQYLILKPSLIGGLKESEKWIELANEFGIGWWVTSALESNVGLSAIAEWVAITTDNDPNLQGLAQGLGTGGLYSNNTASSMYIEDGKLFSHAEKLGSITLEGQTFPLSHSGASEFEALKERPSWTDGIAVALMNWFTKPSSPLSFHTSGSSGTPMEISHSREAVISSAKDTINFFALSPGAKVVLALPIESVAGRLMLVRAIVGGLNLEIIKPSTQLSFSSPVDFIALTTHQCASLLPEFPQCSKVLLGGGVVTEGLRCQLPMEIEFWEGFGMTETITHIAARRVRSEGEPTPFSALPGVTFRTRNDGVLVIDAPNREVHDLETDDLVEIIDSQHFKWIGRESSIINSGGIKVIPEMVEREILELMSPLQCEYIVRGVADDALGEKVVLRIDSDALHKAVEEKLLHEIATLATLPSYHKPREIEYGSINRSVLGKTRRL